MSPYPLTLTSAHFFHSNWRRWWRRERWRRWRSAWWRRGAFLQFLNNLLRSHLQLIQRGALTREEPEDVNVLQGSKNDKSESAFGIKFQVSSWTATATNCHEPTPQLVGRTHNKSGKTMSIIVPKGIWREGCHVLQDIVLISWCGMVKCARKTHAAKPLTRRAAKSPKFRKICLAWREGQNGFRWATQKFQEMQLSADYEYATFLTASLGRHVWKLRVFWIAKRCTWILLLLSSASGFWISDVTFFCCGTTTLLTAPNKNMLSAVAISVTPWRITNNKPFKTISNKTTLLWLKHNIVGSCSYQAPWRKWNVF